MKKEKRPLSSGSFALPARRLLPEILAESIARDIQAGEFKKFLPGTRTLSSLFGVSLPTVGRALRILRERGVIVVRQGFPTSILRRRAAVRRGEPTIGILLTEEMPVGVCWPQQEIVSLIQTALLSRGLTPLLISAKQRGKQIDRKWLANVADSALVHLWLLLSPTKTAQQFFYQKGLPAIVVGSLCPGVELPCLGIDQAAAARHAATTLWRQGHRDILCLRDNADRMGDQVTLEHFSRHLQDLTAGQAHLSVVRCSHDRGGIARALEKALRSDRRVTACFFLHASTALAALTYLFHSERRIPNDLSLFCAQNAEFLRLVHPSIAAYQFNLRAFKNRLLSRIEQNLAGFRTVPSPSDLLIPEFVNGESLTPAIRKFGGH